MREYLFKAPLMGFPLPAICDESNRY